MPIDKEKIKDDVMSFAQTLPHSLQPPRSSSELKSLQESLAKIIRACEKDYPIGGPYSMAETFRFEYENLNKIKNKPPEVKEFCQKFKETHFSLRNSDPLKPIKGMQVVYANVRLPSAPVGPNSSLDFTEMATAIMTANNAKVEVFTDMRAALSPQGKTLPIDTSLCIICVPKDSMYEENGKRYLNREVSATQLYSVIHREPVDQAPALTQPLTNPSFKKDYLVSPEAFEAPVAAEAPEPSKAPAEAEAPESPRVRG